MSDYEELDFGFDNDASASSFGWNFQVNAGIFLFLHYIKEAKSIKIESKKEDIEIVLKEQNRIYAQAKSAQEECSLGSAKKKYKDAIISLAKVSIQNEDVLVYISNLREPIKGGDKFFDNKVVAYGECLKSIQNEIRKMIQEIINMLERKLQNKTAKDVQKKKCRIMLERVKNIDVNKLYFCSIYPYYGQENNRYSVIKDKIIETFSNDIDIGTENARGISKKLLQHWQLGFEHNSTVKDNGIEKSISKEEFIWPVVVFLSEEESINIDDCLTFVVDSSIKKEASYYTESSVSVYHERFAFVNMVLRDYEEYKKGRLGTSVIDVEKMYIRNQYLKFIEEFSDIEDESVKEYVLKSAIYKIIMKNKLIQKVSKEVNL